MKAGKREMNGKRITAFLLSLLMVLAMLPVEAFAGTRGGEDQVPEDRIEEEQDLIGEDITESEEDGAILPDGEGGELLYNGPRADLDDIPRADGGDIYFHDICWHVIGQNENEKLLFAATAFGETADHTHAVENCNWYYILNFNQPEKDVIKSTFHEDTKYANHTVVDLVGERLFFLSPSELLKYTDANSPARLPGDYHLRSLRDDNENYGGFVNSEGQMDFSYQAKGFRPAFVLNLDRVNLISAAEGAKYRTPTDGSSFGGFSDGGSGAKKLTICDFSREGFTADIDGENWAAVQSGGTLDVNYSGAKTGEGEAISALLYDMDETLIGCASMTPESESGTWAITMPALEEGAYSLKVFNEQLNGDQESDYASPFRTISLKTGDVAMLDSILPDDGGLIGFAGRKWIVLGQSKDGNDALLISDLCSEQELTWDEAKNYGDDTLFTAFSTEDQSYVRRVYQIDREYKIDLHDFKQYTGYAAVSLKNARFFLLSGYEAYHYVLNQGRNLRGTNWWLRSPSIESDAFRGVMYYHGGSGYFSVEQGTYSARPAFVLDQSDVLFTSAAAGEKYEAPSDGSSFGTFLDGGSSVRKMTMLDPARDGFTADIGGQTEVTVDNLDTIEVDYSGAGTETGDAVSAMLCNSEDEILGYASMTPEETSGKWELKLPDLEDGTYVLKVFSEKRNDDYFTDYASPLREITLTLADVIQIDDFSPVDGEHFYFGGMPWHVIGENADGSLGLLIADEVSETMNWQSALDYCNTLYEGFSEAEKEAVRDIYHKDRSISTMNNLIFATVPLEGEKLFLMSGYETEKFFGSKEDRLPGNWWLRSPINKSSQFSGVVRADGSIEYTSRSLPTVFGARPVCVLDRSRIVIASAAEGDKTLEPPAGTQFCSLSDAGEAPRKLTLIDSSRSGFTASWASSGTSQIYISPRGRGRIAYEGAVTGSDNYISIMLIASDGTLAGYASQAAENESGTITFRLPNCEQGVYTLKVFNERRNSDHISDEASPVTEIRIDTTMEDEMKDVAVPTFSPLGSVYHTKTFTVTLSCETNDAMIFYTTDGKDPVSYGIEYTDPITVTSTTEIKAFAIKAGWKDSAVVSEVYTHEHSYTSAVTTEPGCTTKGVRTYTCACEDSYTEDIDPLNHAYEWEITKAASCEESGIKTFTCTRCEDSYTEVIDKLGHSYEWEITKAPSYEEAGVKTFTCTRCGDTYTEEIDPLDGSFLLYVNGGGEDTICIEKSVISGGSFTLIPKFAEGKVANDRVVWESANPAVASVSQSGKVTGRSLGKTVITARSEEDPELTASCEVTVTDPVEGIALDKKSYSFGYSEEGGESVQLSATLLPHSASREVKWSTDNAGVLILCDAEGYELSGEKNGKGKVYAVSDLQSVKVKAVGTGKASVTAATADGSNKKAVCKFTVGKAVPAFTIEGKNKKTSVKAGKTLQISVNWGGKKKKPANTGVEWSVLKAPDLSDASDIAVISSKGVLTAITQGTVIVTATSKANPAKTASMEITVTAPAKSKGAKVTGIEFKNKETLADKGLAAGKSYKLTKKLTLSGKGKAPADAVAFISTDNSVATVDQKGVIRGVSAGTVTIKAVTRDTDDVKFAPSDSVTFTVYSGVKSLKLEQTKLILGTQDGAQYGTVKLASLLPEDARTKDIKWAAGSKNVKLAAIAADGSPSTGEFAEPGASVTVEDGKILAVMGISPGTVKLTGTTTDGTKKKVTCTVTVRGQVTGLKLKTKSAKKGVNNITLADKEETADTIEYTGIMKANSTLTLTPVPEINGISAGAKKKADQKLYKAYAKVTDTAISYRSSDITVATVDAKGKISVKKGTAGKTVKIHAASADGKYRAEYEITVK